MGYSEYSQVYSEYSQLYSEYGPSGQVGWWVRYVAGVSWNDAIDVASCQRHFACAYLQSSKAKGPLPMLRHFTPSLAQSR